MSKKYGLETVVPKTALEALEELRIFFNVDMWYSKGCEWKTEKDMVKYLNKHFKICEEQIKEIKLSEQVKSFLEESNKIERVYGEKALEDSLNAWNYAYLNENPFDLEFIKQVHYELLRNLDASIAGKLRTCQVGVMTPEGFDEVTHYSKITEALEKLFLEEPKSLEEIKNWHVRFEKIHPFRDGNGRVGRILMNIQRLKNDHSLLIICAGKEQQEYYQWFKED